MINKKIIHLADFQLEIRNSGEGNRYDECLSVINDTTRKIILETPDMVVITGDLFEFANTTAAERKMLTKFLRDISNVCTVVITNGNHDLKQRNNELIVNHKSVVEPDDIESVLEAMAIDNIHYLKRTGFYNVDGVTFAVWGHYEKFNKVEKDQLPYSPWELEESSKHPHGSVIELFHDPLKGCKGFDSKSMMNFTDYKISTKDFKSPLILAGDIHMPDIINFNNGEFGQTFTYCSSTIMRNFGEGNYYKNGILSQNGNDRHGLNIVHYTLDDNGVATSTIEFVNIQPKVSRHTIILDGEFDYSNIKMLRIEKTEFNNIRFKILDNVAGFFENQDVIYSYLKETCECIMHEPVFDKSVGVEFDDESSITDVEGVLSDDKILESANSYIDKSIDKSTTISKEDSEDAKKMLMDLFKNSFISSDGLTKNIKYVNVNSLEISNGLTFGDDVKIDFNSIGNITRVTGANAVGKTKIFTILGYMFTDLLHSDQKPSQHKNNRLELFNYNRPSDTVHTVMNFTVNDVKHTLTKTVERTWKRGKSMWQDKDWRKYIVGTPSLEIALRKGSETITDYDEVMDYMRDIISFDEFYNHIFVNQWSLENLLKMNTDLLIGEILKIIGLNFFDGLRDSYDSVRDTKMDSITKPSGTIESLLAEIASNKELLSTFVSRKEEIESGILEKNVEKEVEKAFIKKLEEKVSGIRKVADVETGISTTSDAINTKNTNKGILVNNISTSEASMNAIDLVSIESNISSSRTKQRTITEEKSKSKSSLENLDKEVQSKEKELETFIQTSKNLLNTKSNGIDVEINKLNVRKNEINTRLVEINKEVSSELELKVSKNNKIVSEYKSVADASEVSKKAILDESNKVKSEIESNIYRTDVKKGVLKDYESSDKCDSCGEFVKGDTVSKIDATKSEINSLETSLVLLREQKTEIDESYKISNEKYESDKKVYDDSLLVKVTHTILDEPELKKEVQGFSKELGEIKTSIESLESKKNIINADVSYMDDPIVSNTREYILTVSDRKRSLEDSIKGFDTEFYKEDLLIKANESKKTERNTLEINIVKYNSAKQILESEIKSLNEKLETYNNELLVSKGAVDIFKKIEEHQALITSKDSAILMLEREMVELDNKKLSADKVISDNEVSIKNLKEYNLTTSVLKQYKTMLGKSGLQKYIFSQIVSILNGKLSVLLEEVSMRLFFDKDSLELKKFDITKNILSGVKMTSGMETSILGLSLLKALKTMNQIRKFNVMMIDEISGQLNDGTGLSYKAYDYQGLFVNLLNKIKDDTCVYVVDHVIKDLGESSILEVEGSKDGSIVKEQSLTSR